MYIVNEMGCNLGKLETDDYIEVARFNVVFWMMIKLSDVGHDEGMNGSLDNKVEPGEPFNGSPRA